MTRDLMADIGPMLETAGIKSYKWIDPKEIVVAQWVRTKCMFGCPNYGQKAACPPHTPSVRDCQQFFREYRDAVVCHIRIQFDLPEDRFSWYKKMSLRLSRLEREVFLAGFEKVFFLLFGGCSLCKSCMKERVLCRQPERARPSPEAFAVDVYSTVKKLGYPISVRKEMTQAMDRYVFLMLQ